MEVPATREELSLPREEIDPPGMRRVEFVPARESNKLLRELLQAEEAAIANSDKGNVTTGQSSRVTEDRKSLRDLSSHAKLHFAGEPI